MTKRNLLLGTSLALTLGMVSAVSARPQYLMTFKAHYNTAQGKPRLNGANCGLCHIGMPTQRMWNPYGTALREALAATNVMDRPKIIASMQAIESKKRTANAQRNFGQFIAADQTPGAAGMMAAQPNQPPAQPGGGGGGGTAMATAGPWEPVFNGVNMDGLVKMNGGEWSVDALILKYKAGSGNGWLRSAKQFKNYSAILVWKYPNAGNNDSGFFLRAGLAGSPWPQSPQLNMGPQQNMGSIGGITGTRPRYDLIKPNDWNTYQVTVFNGSVSLAINGQVAWEGIPAGFPDTMGYLGIQAEGSALDVAQWWVQPLR